MEIRHTMSQGVVIVAPAGWLDTTSSEEFLDYCTTLPAAPVILDLSGLTYISSTGLRTLLRFGKGQRQQGTDVSIAGSRGFVRSILRMSGFDQFFLMYPSLTDAIETIAKISSSAPGARGSA